MLEILRVVHNNRFMHRDIKPDNIMVGIKPEDRNKIFLCDFGLGKYWVTNRKDPNCREHRPFRDKLTERVGTLRYMSLNQHNFIEFTRRDDLWNLAYTILYFLRKGKLPWSGLGGGMTDNEREAKAT